MKNCFKKTPPRVPVRSSGGLAEICVLFSKDMHIDANADPVKVVKVEKISSDLLSQRADIPKPTDYKLKDMLSQGYVPEAVNLNGFFESNDSLDESNLSLVECAEKSFSNVNNEVSNSLNNE